MLAGDQIWSGMNLFIQHGDKLMPCLDRSLINTKIETIFSSTYVFRYRSYINNLQKQSEGSMGKY